jgi:hypothetical protein
MDANELFHHLLSRDLSPLLRPDGFKGSGKTFRRINGDRTDVIGIQGRRHGGQCCVNLGTHFSFLPSEGGGHVVDPRKLKEYDCAFRERLHDANESDRWWRYGASNAEAEASVASLVDVYKRRAILFFGKFEPFPDAFERITPADLDGGEVSNMPGTTLVRGALTMARIMRHLGRHERCREFAEVGLRHLGRALGLKEELERLRADGAPQLGRSEG